MAEPPPVRAADLPPLPPDLRLGAADLAPIERASRALGRLDGALAAGPADDPVVGHLVWAEAVASSRLAGAALGLRDLLAHEGGAPAAVAAADVRAVARHVAAVEHGLAAVRGGGLLDLRLLREVHEILLLRRDGRGMMPGLFRSSQVWVGGDGPETAAFVPPGPRALRGGLEAFERFLRTPAVPALAKAALAHHRFETLHPFLEGNGRVGRMLAALVLAEGGALAAPVLPLSQALAAEAEAYEAGLQRVRTDGDWAGWLRVFADAVGAAATRAADALAHARRLAEADAATVAAMGRGAPSARAVLDDLRRHPVTTAPAATARLDLSFPTVQAALGRLEAAGVVREVTGGARGRVYAYEGVLAALEVE